MSGKLVVGLNPHGEITSLVFPGRVFLDKSDIMRCIRNAFEKAKAFAEMVQTLVDEDLEKRKALVKADGYTKNLSSDATYSRHLVKEKLQSVDRFKFEVPRDSKEDDGSEETDSDEEMDKDSDEDMDEEGDRSEAPGEDKDILSRIQSIRQLDDRSEARREDKDILSRIQSIRQLDDRSEAPREGKNILSQIQSIRHLTSGGTSAGQPMEDDSESEEEDVKVKLTGEDIL